MVLAGAQTDNNALLFRQGALNKLQSLVDSQDINLVFDQYTPNWDPTRAQNLMEGALTKEGNNIQMVYAANDTLANAAIAALRAQKLNGKVPVTGQNATPTRIQNILAGNQVMTVYKPIPKEAQATAQLVAALSNGTDPGSLINGQTECIAVAKTILRQPKVVLLDEPTAALGVAQTRQVLNLNSAAERTRACRCRYFPQLA